MGKKLEDNGMWESSRMMLPEHREAILESNSNLKQHNKPVLHEEELEIIALGIKESFATHSVITIVLFEPFVNRKVVGVVVRTEQYSKRIRVELNEDEYEWIKLDEIVKVITN
jgi:hypothetical protein